MKTIRNNTRRPLKVQLSRGRVLRLGPAKEGQIATNDAEQVAVQKMIAAGELDIFDDVSHSSSRGSDGASGRSGSQGAHRQFSGSKRGDR